jgi:hypothetical protein
MEKRGEAHRGSIDGEVRRYWRSTTRYFQWFLMAMEYMTAFRRLWRGR